TSLWLWHEHEGYPNIIAKMADWFERKFIDVLAREGESALNRLQFNHPHVGPVAYGMVSDFSLQILHQNRLNAIDGIKRVLNSVSAKIFTDFLITRLRIMTVSEVYINT
ncbi:hypothetical protein Ddye_007269, partial [Dipteronia dyeriana]